MKKLVTNIAFLILFCFSPLITKAENNVVELTVSGYGATQDDARQNALRNAIEEAFGAFVSSNTQILNDKLIKDEIVSVSSGNIQDYKVLSETQTPDGNWANTIKATVSIDKLTSFAESKGVTAEFKGSLFAANVKLQELNKQNEEIAVKNMCQVCKELAEKCFDYEIEVGEPVVYYNEDNEKLWKIPRTIYAIPNNNLETFANYFCSTLEGLSASELDLDLYKKLGIKSYVLFLIDKDGISHYVVLRNKKSLEYLGNCIYYFHKTVFNFQIISKIKNTLGESIAQLVSSAFYDNRTSNYEYIDANGGYMGNFNDIIDLGFRPLCYYNPFRFNDDDEDLNYYMFYLLSDDFRNLRNVDPYSIFDHELHFNYLNYFIIPPKISFEALPIGKKIIQITCYDTLTTDQIERFTGYEIRYCKNKLQRIKIFRNNNDVQFEDKVIKEE